MTGADYDGRLVCLECGGRYRHVGKHVQMKHGMTADEYRAKHGMPARTPLCASDISE